MRRYYLAFIAIILLAVLNAPDARSIEKEEVEAAAIAAEKAEQAWRKEDKRRKKAEEISAKLYEAYMKAGDEYIEAIEAVNALEKAETKGGEAARVAAEKAEREASIRRDNASDEYESARAILTAAEFEAFKREHEMRITKERAQDLIIERQREEAAAIAAKKAAQRKAVEEAYAKARDEWKKADADVKERRKKEMQACNTKAQKEIFPPGWIEQEKMLRQLTGHGSIEFARLQNAFSQAVAKCHQKVENSFPRPQAPSYIEIEKRHQFGLRPSHNLEE